MRVFSLVIVIMVISKQQIHMVEEDALGSESKCSIELLAHSKIWNNLNTFAGSEPENVL